MQDILFLSSYSVDSDGICLITRLIIVVSSSLIPQYPEYQHVNIKIVFLCVPVFMHKYSHLNTLSE